MTSNTANAGSSRDVRRARVSLVIPAMNEERNLPHVFARIPDLVDEVILVDGNSVDRTVELARELRPDIVVVGQTRRGKGNALACGFAACTGDIIVAIDADGSTDPGEIPMFVEAIRDGADYVKGTRFGLGGRSDDITRIRLAGNRVLGGIVNVLFGTRFTDLCYGYNAMRAEVLPALDLPPLHVEVPEGGRVWGDGFEVETLMNLRAAHAKLEIAEVPSIEAERLHGVSNLNAVSDGLRVLRTIVRERMRRSRRFVPAPAEPTNVAIFESADAAAPLTAPAESTAAVRADKVAVDLMPDVVEDVDLTDNVVDLRDRTSQHSAVDGLAEKLS